MTDKRLEMINQIAAQITNDVIIGLQESIRCCIHCEFWLSDKENCNNPVNCPNGPARPPATIIAFGCDHFKGKAPF